MRVAMRSGRCRAERPSPFGNNGRAGAAERDVAIGPWPHEQATSRPRLSSPSPSLAASLAAATVSAAKLIQSLDRRRYQPVVILHQLEGPLADMLREVGIGFEPAPSERFLDGASLRHDAGFVLTQTLRFARFLRQREVRIVHTNDGYSHATWALPTRLAGARLLWHHRKDPDAKGLRYLAPGRLIGWSPSRSSRRPNRVCSRRPARARWCTARSTPTARQRTGAAPAPASWRNSGCGPDTRVIGFFGNLMARKRPLLFVDAIAEMRARAPDLPLAAPIFGEDREDLTEAIKDRARARGVADCIHLMGFRYPPERWLAACEVLLVPAVDEPFGRTLIEAMLLGTVVVAAASGGNPEAIRDGVTGCLVPPDDAAAFAERDARSARRSDDGGLFGRRGATRCARPLRPASARRGDHARV